MQMTKSFQTPPDPGPGTAPPYRISTIARLTSFSSQRLRAWERRYGFLTPKRGPGGHRLYGADDLRILEAVRRLLDCGRTIGEISAMGRTALLGGPAAPVPAGPAPSIAADGHRSGARPGQWVGRMVDAALSIDSRAINALLDEAFAALPTEQVVHGVIGEALHRIGVLWEEGRCSVACEHVATGVFVHRVRTLVEASARAIPGPGPRILCACLPAERHELGLLAIGYSLAIRGSRVTLLGPDVPFADIEDACRSVAPHAVLLSVSTEPTCQDAMAGLLRFRGRLDPGVVAVLGGGGVPNDGASLASFLVVRPRTPPAEIAESVLASIRDAGDRTPEREPSSREAGAPSP